MGAPRVVVTFDPGEAGRAAAAAELGGCEVVYLPDLGEPSRRGALADATVLLARNTGTELRPGEPALIRRARLVRFVTAGVDFVPLGDLPAEVPVACNGGACAEPMAEHALAMVCPAISTYRPADDRRRE